LDFHGIASCSAEAACRDNQLAGTARRQSRARRSLARRSEPLMASTALACLGSLDGRRSGNMIPLVGFEHGFWTAGPITAAALTRRLITLICAGRNRMDTIRRELPRTSSAGWVRRQYRIILLEGSPFRGPRLPPALLSSEASSGLPGSIGTGLGYGRRWPT
jgi:hypothetical protein